MLHSGHVDMQKEHFMLNYAVRCHRRLAENVEQSDHTIVDIHGLHRTRGVRKGQVIM